MFACILKRLGLTLALMGDVNDHTAVAVSGSVLLQQFTESN